jgi:MFS transporter, MHS family, proline/betaine transporter
VSGPVAKPATGIPDSAEPHADLRQQGRIVPGVIAGNVIDWYDFTLVVYLSTEIARVISPAGAGSASLIFTFAIFGVGFIARPVGAFVFGRIGDKVSRKTSLLLTVCLMALGTGLIAFLPSYASVGNLSPLCLLLSRLLQGFATGGEWGGGTAMIVENAPPGRRGILGGVLQASGALGPFFAAAAVNILTHVLSPADVSAWGWRLPFVVGLVLAPIAYVLRSRLHIEDRKPVIKDTSTARSGGLRTFFTASGLVALIFASYNTLYYMDTFSERYFGLDKHSASAANTLGVLALVLTILPSAWLSDRIGRRPVLMVGAGAVAVLTLPLFMLLARGTHEPWMPVPVIVFGIVIGIFAGPFPTTMTELFRSASRQTNMGIVYNGVGLLFGGFAASISTWLITMTGEPLAAAALCTLGAAMAFVALLFVREPAFRPLQ